MKATIATFIVILVGAANLGAGCLFRGTPFLETGGDRPDMAVADFNRDGFPDVAFASAESRAVRVFENQGDGSFALSQEKRFESSPKRIEAGDFNGDGALDLAVAVAPSVIILLNDGNGLMKTGERVPVAATAIAAGDFNSDSFADLAAISPPGSQSAVIVFINTDGSFTRAQSMPVRSPSDLIAVRLGSARYTDLVVSSETGTVHVFRGTGAGTFLQAIPVKAVQGASHMVSGFIDEDDLLDLMVAGKNGEAVALLGRNQTQFERVLFSTTSSIEGMAFADINDDDHADLLLVNGYSRLLFYHGNGRGAFSFQRSRGWGFFTGPIATGDFNADGNDDFIAGERGSAGVFLSNGDAGFTTGVRTVVKQGGSIVAGDFDADGHEDLILSSSTGSILIRGKGDGSFHPPIRTILPFMGYAVVSDLDGDGRDDVAGFDHLNLKTWLSKDGVGFVQTGSFSMSVDPPVQAIDLNGDGLLDLAVMIPGQLRVVLNQQNGKFEAARPILFKNQKKGTVADLNGDQFPDLATVHEGNQNALNVYIGGASLSFVLHGTTLLQKCPGGISSGDANGDGNTDLVVGSTCESRVSLFLGDGKGNFTKYLDAPSGSGSNEPAIADLNGDGKGEIFAIARRLGKPTVTLAPEFKDQFLLGPLYWNSLAVADFDGDGHPDIAASSFHSTGLFLNCQ